VGQYIYIHIHNLTNLTNLDANGRVTRFHNLRTEWGFDRLLSHDTLYESSKGYLVDDSCAVGVEVFVIKGTCKGECLSMISTQPQSNYFTWKIENYTDLKDEFYFSEQFTVEGRQWYDWRFEGLFIYIRLILLVYNYLLLYILDIGS
jgi:hypothetical protein